MITVKQKAAKITFEIEFRISKLKFRKLEKASSSLYFAGNLMQMSEAQWKQGNEATLVCSNLFEFLCKSERMTYVAGISHRTNRK
jgi:hypothetical protein